MNVTQDDLCREIRNGSRMAIRFHVARILGNYFFNRLPSEEKVVIFEEEIKIQSNELLERFELGEDVVDLIREFEREGK